MTALSTLNSDPSYNLPIIEVIYLFILFNNSKYLDNKKTINTLKNPKIKVKYWHILYDFVINFTRWKMPENLREDIIS